MSKAAAADKTAMAATVAAAEAWAKTRVRAAKSPRGTWRVDYASSPANFASDEWASAGKWQSQDAAESAAKALASMLTVAYLAGAGIEVA